MLPPPSSAPPRAELAHHPHPTSIHLQPPLHPLSAPLIMPYPVPTDPVAVASLPNDIGCKPDAKRCYCGTRVCRYHPGDMALARQIARHDCFVMCNCAGSACKDVCVCPNVSACRRGQAGRVKVADNINSAVEKARKTAEKGRSAYESRDCKDHYAGLVAMRLEEEIDEAEKEIRALKQTRCKLDERRKQLVSCLLTKAGGLAGQVESHSLENDMLKRRVAQLEARIRADEEAYVEHDSHDLLGERHNMMSLHGGDAVVGGAGTVTDFPPLECCSKFVEGHDYDNRMIFEFGARCRQGGYTSANAPAS